MAARDPALTLYLRPIGFVAPPVGADDGRRARLAGGWTWFTAYEVRARDGWRDMVPVAGFDQWVVGLSADDADRARLLHRRITSPRAPVDLGGRSLPLDRPQVMGILNVTPDSFSDGGAHIGDAAGAAAAGVAMAAAGAALVDLGGESTRPGAKAVVVGEELARVVPVARLLAAAGVAISVDTRRAAVMAATLAAGAHLVNDVAALEYDPDALDVVARAGCPVVLMHSPEPSSGPHGGTGYGDPLLDVFDWLEARVAAVEAAGVDRARILVDPGIGFGKALSDNLALIDGLALFHALGCGVLLGASRKRIIAALSDDAPSDQRLGGSIALALAGVARGVQVVRVHDVAETVQAIRIWTAIDRPSS